MSPRQHRITPIASGMKTTLDHLPEDKQQLIDHIRRLILNEVDAYLEPKSGKKAAGRVRWIVLFGSYARGDYVEEPENGYVSDMDVLVVVTDEELANAYPVWSAIEDKVERRTPVPLTLIVHEQEEVLRWLQQGHYFFADITREAIYLFAHSAKPLPEGKALTSAQRLPIAEKHFAQWFSSAESFLIDFGHCVARSDYKKAAFELHQATERFYACLLLVFTNYRPKTHNLKLLHRMALNATDQETRLAEVFANRNRFEKRCFELLKRAYVDARYSEHFKITREELDWLAQEVETLNAHVNTLCQTHIATLKSNRDK